MMHTMNLIKEHEGTEEWLCPDCGRHMLVAWKPEFKRTVLEPGDENLAHSGNRGGLNLEAVQTAKGNVDGLLSESEIFTRDPYLRPYLRWANQFDWSN